MYMLFCFDFEINCFPLMVLIYHLVFTMRNTYNKCIMILIRYYNDAMYTDMDMLFSPAIEKLNVY